MSNNRSTPKKNNSSNNENSEKNNLGSDDYPKPSLLSEGEERKVYEERNDRRILGGAAVTKEAVQDAYASALKQWQELPNSIVRPPTDVTLPTKKHTKSLDMLTSSEQTNADSSKGEPSD
jgi:hypothetical protein